VYLIEVVKQSKGVVVLGMLHKEEILLTVVQERDLFLSLVEVEM
jgi:hypothetical protein